MDLIIATKNRGKLEEIKALLKDLDVKISSLADLHNIPEIVEDGKTFLENARKKAQITAKAAGKWVLADDSGLAVDALHGAPGVNSARFAGKQGDYDSNNSKLLHEMDKIPDGKRKAHFICVAVLLSPEGKEWSVEERCDGEIIRELRGAKGFGYDPLFFIPTMEKTMAELNMDEKNKISHRGKAFRKIKEIIKKLTLKE